VVLLEVFAIVVFACAIAAEYLGTIIERLNTHVDVARDEAERGHEFWATLIEDLPLPALMVDIDTLQIVCASKQAAAFCATEPTPGMELFKAVQFSYPDAVQELITVADGVVPVSMIHVREQLCVTQVRVQHMAQKDRRLALVIIEDQTQQFHAKAALDATGQAVLVIDARGRVISFNRPARALFAGIENHVEAAELLSLAGMPARWWEPGLTGRRKMYVEIAPRAYEVTSSASPLPGEEQRLYIVTFLPVARAAAGDQTAITGTVRTLDLSNATIASRTLVSPP
jgi:PAS domain-containing protein